MLVFKKQPHYYRAEYGFAPKKSKAPFVIAGFIVVALLAAGLFVSIKGPHDGEQTIHSSQSPHDAASETPAQKLNASDSAEEVPTSRLLLDM